MKTEYTRRDLLLYAGATAGSLFLPGSANAELFRKLRICATNRSNSAIAEATFSWESVATEVALAIVSYLATEAFERIFRSGQDQQDQLMQAVRDILQGQDRARMNSAISWHRTAVDQALLFRGDRAKEQRLINAEEKSTYAKNELQSLGVNAREPWFIAAELRLSIAQEWHNINPGRSEQEAIEREIQAMRDYFNECERIDLALVCVQQIPFKCINKMVDFPNPGDTTYIWGGSFEPEPKIAKRIKFLNVTQSKITEFEVKLISGTST